MLLQITPSTVNNLCPSFDRQTGATRKPMLFNHHIFGLEPYILNLLLLVYDPVVQHSRDFHLVTSSTVGVENQSPVLESLQSERFPVCFPNGPRTRGPETSRV